MTDMDVGEAARMLGVSERTIRRWLAQGRLAGYRLGGRVRVPARAIGEALAPYGSNPASPTVDQPDSSGIETYLAGRERLLARRRAAAATMDRIRARSRPARNESETADALLREERLEREGRPGGTRRTEELGGGGTGA